jgi:hypothetical protein
MERDTRESISKRMIEARDQRNFGGKRKEHGISPDATGD